MPAERFFIDAEFQGTISMEGNELHHLAHVMRIDEGEEIEIVNGRGSLAQARVEQIGKKQALLKILSIQKSSISPPKMILAIPFMRLSKLEWTVEKGTELGAESFWFYPAHQSEKEQISEHQLERLRTISISAMKQCGRLDLPNIQVLGRFEDLFREGKNFFYGDTRLGALPMAQQEEMVFITGPEKGFSEKEIKLLQEKAAGVSLHKNILRAETAPLVALITASMIVPGRNRTCI